MWVTQRQHLTHRSAPSPLSGSGTLTLGNWRHFVGTLGLRGWDEWRWGINCRESSAVKTASEQGNILSQDTQQGVEAPGPTLEFPGTSSLWDPGFFSCGGGKHFHGNLRSHSPSGWYRGWSPFCPFEVPQFNNSRKWMLAKH